MSNAVPIIEISKRMLWAAEFLGGVNSKRIGLEMPVKMRYTDKRILQMLVLSAITLRRILSWYQQEILEMV